MVLPNIDPQSYSLSAVLIGVILTDDLSPSEANSVGNWLVLVGDYLLAYAGQKNLIANRTNPYVKQSDFNSVIHALKKMETELAKMQDHS